MPRGGAGGDGHADLRRLSPAGPAAPSCSNGGPQPSAIGSLACLTAGSAMQVSCLALAARSVRGIMRSPGNRRPFAIFRNFQVIIVEAAEHVLRGGRGIPCRRVDPGRRSEQRGETRRRRWTQPVLHASKRSLFYQAVAYQLCLPGEQLSPVALRLDPLHALS